MSTHYDSLKVTEDAPQEVIRAAYRALCLKYHPDLCGGGPQAQRRMQTLNEAYGVLSDPHRRADYDGMLHRQRHPAPPPPVNRAQAMPRERHRVPYDRPRPAWLKAMIYYLSDARVVLPAVAVIWWIVIHLLAHS